MSNDMPGCTAHLSSGCHRDGFTVLSIPASCIALPVTPPVTFLSSLAESLPHALRHDRQTSIFLDISQLHKEMSMKTVFPLPQEKSFSTWQSPWVMYPQIPRPRVFFLRHRLQGRKSKKYIFFLSAVLLLLSESFANLCLQFLQIFVFFLPPMQVTSLFE